MMTVKELKEALKNAPDDMEVLIGCEIFRETKCAKVDDGFKKGGWGGPYVQKYFVIDAIEC